MDRRPDMPPVLVAIVSELELLAEGVEVLLETDPRIRVVSRHKCLAGALQISGADVVVGSFLCATRCRAFGEVIAAGRTKVIVLADPDDSIDMKQLMRAGVSGVVLTNMPSSLLVQSILKVHEGGVWLEKEAVLRHFRREERGASVSSLSQREVEVFSMAAVGLRNREIAERLFISDATVKVHLSKIFEKLKVKSRVELCLLAQERKTEPTINANCQK